MDEEMTALAKEMQNLGERQLQYRHDALMRRMPIHEERMNFQSEILQTPIAAGFPMRRRARVHH